MVRRLLLVAAVATLASAGDVRAEGAETETARLLQSHVTERYNVGIPGVSIRAGGGMTAVSAPIAVVRQVVTDYSHYAEFMPRFQKSRIVNKSAAGTDVYLQVPILHGAATVWAVTRFLPPVPEAGGERIEGRMEGQGNVDDLRAIWHLRSIDESHTLLKIELLIVPKLPLPGSLVTPELEFASDQAVSATRDRAETNVHKTARGPESAH